MSRPRKSPLPRGIYERRGTYYVSFQWAGRQRQERAGSDLRAAVALRARRLAEVEAGTYRPDAPTGEMTLADRATTWSTERAAAGKRSAEREAQILRDHVVPYLGSIRLSELRPRDFERWVRDLEGKISPKSILNAHGVLSALLARCVFDELVSVNVARGLPRGILPRNVRTRKIGAWTADDCHALMTHEAIPEDRRIAHAIAAYTGARVGEIAGLRWSHIDTKAAPLWRWELRTQYDGEPLKTDSPRDVPIHAALRELLEEWRRVGWARLVGRLPRPDDLVLPRADGTMHSKESLGAKSAKRYARAAGVDAAGRDFHSFRRAMITNARSNGARAEILERVTHNAAGEMIDGYTYFGWDVLCEAVSCIRIAPAAVASVVSIQRAANGSAHDESMTRKSEAPGTVVIPGAFDGGAGSRTRVRERSALASTCVARVLYRDPARPSGRLSVPLSTLCLRPISRVAWRELVSSMTPPRER